MRSPSAARNPLSDQGHGRRCPQLQLKVLTSDDTIAICVSIKIKKSYIEAAKLGESTISEEPLKSSEFGGTVPASEDGFIPVCKTATDNTSQVSCPRSPRTCASARSLLASPRERGLPRTSLGRSID